MQEVNQKQGFILVQNFYTWANIVELKVKAGQENEKVRKVVQIFIFVGSYSL